MNGMKKKLLIFAIISTFILLCIYRTKAEDLTSPNFEVKDFSFKFTEGVGGSGTNFKTLLGNDEFLRDQRFDSANYSYKIGVENTWSAHVPKVQCFETTTEGTSSCSDPALVDGITNLCGDGGCFDRARFEIDSQNNPPDTL